MSVPASADALLAAAIRFHQQGDRQRAEAAYGQLLAVAPGHPVATHNLALLLIESGRMSRARGLLERLVAARPADGPAQFMLGKLLRVQGALVKSRHHLRQAVAAAPADINAYIELIALEAARGDLAAAREVGMLAVERFPRRVEIVLQLGAAAASLGAPAEARQHFARALEIAPDSPGEAAVALYNLGKLADEADAIDAALDFYRRAHAADPSFEPAALNLGDLALRLGELDTAIAALDTALAHHPQDAAALSNRLMAAQYQPGVTAQSLAALHRGWDARLGPVIGPVRTRHALSRDPARRLRVGIVSADLRAHATAYFTVRAIEHVDPAAIELYAYNAGPPEKAPAGAPEKTPGDPYRRRFRQAIRNWRDVGALPDDALAAQIERDRIDIAIDLSGHCAGSRLAALAHKPAPLQVTWAGYVGTTGLAAIDGLIADRFHVPAGEDAAYVERVLRLPDSFMCFDPPADAPDVAPLPARHAGHVTFCSFNNPAKVNREAVTLWARVLAAVPGSRMLLAYRGFEAQSVQARVAGWFAASGIAADRIAFGGGLPRRDFLALYAAADVALDPLPYSGSTTTCEALWMGVPVVTLPGDSFAGRHSQSFLATVGLTETIAADADAYVAIATGLAADLDRLAVLRAGLRARVAASPLCDGARFARHLFAALRDLWRAWCVS